MKVTKFLQSCLLVENDGRCILIDPGRPFAAKHQLAELPRLSAILITHRHADHLDADFIAQAAAERISVYANADVNKVVENVQLVRDQDKFEVDGFSVQAIDLPHCLMVDGSAGPPNTGFLIDSKLLHPGDGKELAGLIVDYLALPISGPDISMHDAANFANQVKAKRVIPVHYDLMGGKPEIFARMYQGAEVVILADAESVEL